MLIRESISGYKHFDLGNIKIAFTQVCQEETFKNVFFAANSLYYVESGSTVLSSSNSIVKAKTGEVVLIKQHSKLDIQKFRDKNGKDFKSIIFYLFPDFISDFIKQTKEIKNQPETIPLDVIHLGKDKLLKDFFESLLPLFA
ncbi:MAG: hypothetical protein JSS82_14285 [Bacteroidetes bacterium]|nr:hypothetical protein [Bacteroidota bacterium]